MRQEEALKELKTLLDQVYDKNIYSKVNKISKDEINIFNSIPFDITFDKTKTSYVNGGIHSPQEMLWITLKEICIVDMEFMKLN